jgi:hypothetical protein
MSDGARDRRLGVWLLLGATAAGSLAALELRQRWARELHTPWLWVALIAAAGLGAAELLRTERWLPDARPPARPEHAARRISRRIGLVCLAAAVVLSVWIMWRLWPDYHIWNGTVVPWVGALGLIAIAGALLGSCARANEPNLEFAADTESEAPTRRSFPRSLEVAAFLVIAALAIFLRVYRIGAIPAGIYVDETNGALDALHLLGGQAVTPFGTGWYGTPSLYTYYMAAVFKVAGVGWLSLKAVSLIPAILTVLAIYPLGRLLFGPLGGLSSMAFLAVNRWHMTMSRWGWNETAPPLFQILATFFLLRGLRDRRSSDFVFGGLLSGLMMYTYLSSRLALATLGVFAVYFLVVERGGPWLAWRRHWRGLVLFLVAWAVAVAPIAVTHITDPFTFFNRVGQISVFNDVRAAGSYRPLWLNIADHLEFFHQTGDRQSKHNLPGEPETDPLVGALFVIGLAYGTLRLRDHRRGLLWLWLLFGLAGGIFSNHSESPQSYRTLTAVPAVALLAGDVLARLARSLSARRKPAQGESTLRMLAPATATAFLVAAAGWAVSGAWEANVYFRRQAPAPEYQAGFNPIENGVARDVLKALDDHLEVYVSPRFAEYSPLQFLAYGWQTHHTNHPSLDDQPYHAISMGSDLPVPDTGRNALFLFDLMLWPLRGYFLHFYPDANLELARGPDGVPIYVRASVSRADILRRKGLSLRYTTSAGPVVERVVPTVDAGQVPPGVATATWRGGIDVPRSGTYDFETRSGVELALDGRRWTGPAFLARGLHALEVELRDMHSTAGWRLSWRSPDGTTAPVPPDVFSQMAPPDEGLTALYYPNTTWSGPAVSARPTPLLLLTFTPPEPIPDHPAFSIRFLGSLQAPTTGRYGFRMEADDAATLWIDGKRVTEDAIARPSPEKPAVVRLAQGRHEMRIDYVQFGGGGELRVWWRPPGGAEGLIPPGALGPGVTTQPR